MLRRIFPYLTWICGSWILLTACSSGIATSPLMESQIPDMNAIQSYSQTPVSQTTLESKPDEVIAPRAEFTPFATLMRPETNQSAAPGLQPCSPLDSQTLSELPEIISDPYHPPPMGKDDRHQGVDFSYYRRGERLSIEGEQVLAVLPGKVAASIQDSFPFGNILIVETRAGLLPAGLYERIGIPAGASIYLLYAHLADAPDFQIGDLLYICQPIGRVGKSGNAGVAHLHLEARYGAPGAEFPLMGYYLADTTPEERAYYILWRMSGEFQHFDPMVLLLWSGVKQ